MRYLLYLACLLLATSCSIYKPTVAGTVSRKGAPNVPKRPIENRHF